MIDRFFRWFLWLLMEAFIASLWLACISTAAAAENSRAGRHEWEQVATIDAPLAILTHYLDRSAFNGVMRANGFRAPYRETQGFAVLRRITSNGVVRYQCDVYLAPEADSRVLEHELRHCDGWDHQ